MISCCDIRNDQALVHVVPMMEGSAAVGFSTATERPHRGSDPGTAGANLTDRSETDGGPVREAGDSEHERDIAIQ